MSIPVQTRPPISASGATSTTLPLLPPQPVIAATTEPARQLPELEAALRALETRGRAVTSWMPLVYYVPALSVIAAAVLYVCKVAEGQPGILCAALAGVAGSMVITRPLERSAAARAYERFDKELAPTIDDIERLAPTVAEAQRPKLADRLLGIVRELGARWVDADWTTGRSAEEQPSLHRLLKLNRSLRSPPKQGASDGGL